MKYNKIAIIEVILGLSLTAVSLSSADALPGGSYRLTCSGASASNNTLTASCETTSGSMKPTSLPSISTCVGDIANINGDLFCNRVATPAGSYTRTCRTVSLVNNVLAAACETTNGTWKPSQLWWPSGCLSDISNVNGTLTCTGRGAPGGTYNSTCSNAFAQNDTLFATCRTINGAEVTSTRTQLSTCIGDIANINGELTCDRRGSLPGTYKGSCVNASWNASTLVLSASCRTTSGTWHSTTLTDTNGCKGDISNENGTLSCNRTIGIPAGSFSRTCVNPSVVNGRLSATCEKKNGAWIPASLNIGACVQDIQNADGELTCVSDCGDQSRACCAGNVCNAGLLCSSGSVCLPCGSRGVGCCTQGQAACQQTPSQPLYCTGAPGTALATCQPCAGLHQPHCPVGTTLPYCLGSLKGTTTCE